VQWIPAPCANSAMYFMYLICLQCFDTVGGASGMSNILLLQSLKDFPGSPVASLPNTWWP